MKPTKEQLQATIREVVNKDISLLNIEIVRKSKSPAVHGTLSKYTQGCRCIPCRDSATTYARNKRLTNRTQPIPSNVRHGTKYAYSAYGCRCRPCTDVAVAHVRKYAETPEQKRKRNERKKLARRAYMATRTPEQAEADRKAERERTKRRKAKAKGQTLVE